MARFSFDLTPEGPEKTLNLHGSRGATRTFQEKPAWRWVRGSTCTLSMAGGDEGDGQSCRSSEATRLGAKAEAGEEEPRATRKVSWGSCSLNTGGTGLRWWSRFRDIFPQ